MNCSAVAAMVASPAIGCSPCGCRRIVLPSYSRRRRHPPFQRRQVRQISASAYSHPRQQWDEATSRFTALSNLPFILIQIPQISLNARNLMSGNSAALLAVPWIGMLTGLLGNLTLLSYFVKKKETEAVIVQALGVSSIYVVLSQLAIARAMPSFVFVSVSAVVVIGLVFNSLKYFNVVASEVWSLWVDFITVLGISVLPQVMWSTFVPSIPQSTVPGLAACSLAIAAVTMARIGKLPQPGVDFLRSTSGWTATLLFMWMPVAQMWTTYLNPDNIKGLSSLTILFGMIGNALMIPRALFIRDLMWFTGASWAAILHGFGNLACMYFFSSIGTGFFTAATLGLFLWLGFSLWKDAATYGYSSPVQSLKELLKL